MTKTRQAQLILESTAASMAVVTLLWLLLWFLWQTATSFPIRVLYVPDRDVPFQRADAEAILGPDGEVQPFSQARLLSQVETLVSKPNEPPILLLISTPAFGGDAEARLGDQQSENQVKELIELVAAKARRKVLLALDFAQIDSDLGRHLYGNSPFTGLRELVQETTFPDQTESVWVLCASEPGQKSWTADRLGRSIFSYYVQKGISGSAKAWDTDPGGGQVVTVEGLARYVRQGVRNWVYEDRSRAVQTPVLMKVGKQTRDFSFPGVMPVARIEIEEKSPPSPDPKAGKTSDPKTKGKEGGGKEEKPAPSAPPHERLLEDLVKEWGEHDRLRTGEPVYRRLPNGWKRYEARLLNAERLVRAGWSDPGSLDSADKVLRQVEETRQDLENRHRAALEEDWTFPFQPILGEDQVHSDRLYRLLRQLTDSDILLEDVQPSRPVVSVKHQPKPEDSPSGGMEAVSRKTAEPAVSVEEAWASGPWPETYLELQVPIWAARFTAQYGLPDLFKDQNRAALLKKTVLARISGERAMALDRRGLTWIIDEIQEADEIRRQSQDGLFSIADAPDPDPRLKQVSQFEDRYNQALTRITAYHDARNLIEQIAAELPYYAESEILASARELPLDNDSDALPKVVKEAIDHAARLIRALEGEGAQDSSAYFERLGIDVKPALNSFQNLREAYLKRASRISVEISRRDPVPFREIDDLLRTPLLPPEQRDEILRSVVSLDKNDPPTLTPPSAADLALPRNEPETGPDPGFFRKALGLAALDAELLRLGLSPGDPLQDVDSKLKTLRDRRKAAPDFTASSQTPRVFQALSGELNARTGSPSATGSREPLLASLLAGDRASRFSETGQDAPADSPAARLEDYARRRALEWHAARLARDYAPEGDVRNLYHYAVTLYSDAEPPNHPSYKGVIELACSPETPVVPINDDAERDVELRAQPESATLAKVPPGRAFVGLVRVEPDRRAVDDPAKPPQPSKLVVSPGDGAAARRGRVVGGLVEVGASTPSRPVSVHLKQILQRNGASEQEPFVASLFYRGRGDDDPRSKRSLTVALAEIKQPVQVRISHDVEYLRREYPHDFPLIADPFEDRQNAAYVHFHKDLRYRLIFTNNRSSDPVSLTYQRTVEPATGGGEKVPIDKKPVTREIEPGARFELVGQTLSWRLIPEPEDVAKPRDLVVRMTVSVNGGEPIELDELRVELRQVHLREYMRFDPRPDVVETPDGRRMCWVVTATRLTSDPVTEPIKLSEITGHIDVATLRQSEGGSILANEGRNVFEMYRSTPPLEPGRKVKWSFEVEKDSVEGEITYR